ncbi:PqqD family protein, partial [Candidatus Fermentibacteria bacterium]
MHFSPADKIKISDQVLSQEVSGETVLLDLGSEFYFGLDKTGTRIWELLQSGLSIEELIGKMLDEFEVDRE